MSYLTEAPRHFRLETATSLLSKIETVGHFSAVRLAHNAEGLGMVESIPPESTFVLVWQLRDCPKTELWLDGKAVKNPVHRKNNIELYDLECDTRCYIESPMDSMHLCIPKQAIATLAEEEGLIAPRSLSARLGSSLEDPVVPLLGKLLIPMLERPHQVDLLSLDHVATSIMVYVARSYGQTKVSAPRPAAALTPGQLRTVKEMLNANIDGRITLAEIAAACQLSRSYLAKSFQRTMGVSPHRWLMGRRVELAKTLLGNEKMPLSEVAQVCGFADQSHLSRIFTRFTGATPGAYRKARC